MKFDSALIGKLKSVSKTSLFIVWTNILQCKAGKS